MAGVLVMVDESLHERGCLKRVVIRALVPSTQLVEFGRQIVDCNQQPIYSLLPRHQREIDSLRPCRLRWLVQLAPKVLGPSVRLRWVERLKFILHVRRFELLQQVEVEGPPDGAQLLKMPSPNLLLLSSELGPVFLLCLVQPEVMLLLPHPLQGEIRLQFVPRLDSVRKLALKPLAMLGLCLNLGL